MPLGAPRAHLNFPRDRLPFPISLTGADTYTQGAKSCPAELAYNWVGSSFAHTPSDLPRLIPKRGYYAASAFFGFSGPKTKSVYFGSWKSSLTLSVPSACIRLKISLPCMY